MFGGINNIGLNPDLKVRLKELRPLYQILILYYYQDLHHGDIRGGDFFVLSGPGPLVSFLVIVVLV